MLESNTKIEEMKEEVEEMDREIMKYEKNVEFLSKENKDLQYKIIERSKEYEQVYSLNVTLKEKLK